MGIVRLTPPEARRVALAAQGFHAARPAKAGPRHLAATIDRLGLHQIDSVNVLVRAHYLPAFSRLGAYDTSVLDRRAWGPKRDRRLFEYWAHECSLLPLSLHPLLRWRMERADRGEAGYRAMRTFATERRPEAMALLARLRDEGPLSASDIQTGRAGWWEWSEPKRMLEWLFYAGHVTTATRRRSFERVYDLTERVIPPDILSLPDVPEAEAQAQLVALSARALGLATASELRDYFRLDARTPPRPSPGWWRRASCSRPRCPAGPPPTSTATPHSPAASRPEPCSPPSTPWSGSAPAPSACSVFAIASRSTPRRRSGSTGITCSRSCSGRRWWGGWI